MDLGGGQTNIVSGMLAGGGMLCQAGVQTGRKSVQNSGICGSLCCIQYGLQETQARESQSNITHDF